MRKALMKVMIRTPGGKLQEFTFVAKVENPDIQLAKVLFELEQAINKNSPYRAHTDIGSYE